MIKESKNEKILRFNYIIEQENKLGKGIFKYWIRI